MSYIKLPKRGFCKTYVCYLKKGQIFQLRDTKTAPLWQYEGWSDTYNSYIAYRLSDGHRKDLTLSTSVVLKINPIF